MALQWATRYEQRKAQQVVAYRPKGQLQDTRRYHFIMTYNLTAVVTAIVVLQQLPVKQTASMRVVSTKLPPRRTITAILSSTPSLWCIQSHQPSFSTTLPLHPRISCTYLNLMRPNAGFWFLNANQLCRLRRWKKDVDDPSRQTLELEPLPHSNNISIK